MIAIQFLYIPIAWKQWLLLTKAMQFMYWCHNGRPNSADVPGMYMNYAKQLLTAHSQ